MTRFQWPLAVFGTVALAVLVYTSSPANRPTIVKEPVLTPEEVAARDKLRDLTNARHSSDIQTGTGDENFVPGEALLIFAPAKIVRPKPNEGDTGSHWFSEEAATSEQRG